MSDVARILLVVGARPNFIKAAPLLRALKQQPAVICRLLHTSQHTDELMSGSQFADLGLPVPDVSLRASRRGSVTTTANALIGIEADLRRHPQDAVLVLGDVDSTLAAALAAAKLQVAVAHVEAGLRCGDRTMPEEINRILVDRIATLHYVSEQAGLDHLMREGISGPHVCIVGNIMVDACHMALHDKSTPAFAELRASLPEHFSLFTAHRPANVDSANSIGTLVHLLTRLAERSTLLFPVHPRTRASLLRHGRYAELRALPKLHLVDPLTHSSMVKAVAAAELVYTDSGGLQIEAAVCGTPCVTLRPVTEAVATLTGQRNATCTSLVPEVVLAARLRVLNAAKQPQPPLPWSWDGHSADRIVEHLLRHISKAPRPLA